MSDIMIIILYSFSDVYINQMIVEILNASNEEFLTVLPHDFNISVS